MTLAIVAIVADTEAGAIFLLLVTLAAWDIALVLYAIAFGGLKPYLDRFAPVSV